MQARLHNEFEEVVLRKEISSRQNDRIKWVTDRECNSKLFHKVLVEVRVGV